MSEDQIEDLAYNCLRRGRDFAQLCDAVTIPMPPALTKSYRYLLHRLNNGVVLGRLDIETLESIGRALCEAMNDRRPGYGDHAFKCFTDEDVLFDAELEKMRRAMEGLKALLQANSVLSDRSTARRWANSLETLPD